MGFVSVSVLLVDDYEPWRRFVSSTLKHKLNCQIIYEASDGFEAIQRARELQPNLILLDIGLPTLNGIEAARRIRKLAPESKIIFLSQESSADIVGEALSLGAQGYVVKSDARIWGHEGHQESERRAARGTHGHSRSEVARAWLPWLILSVLVFCWGTYTGKKIMNTPEKVFTSTSAWRLPLSKITNAQIPVPGLNKMVQRVPPVVARPTAEAAVFGFNWLSATGSGILIAAIISGFIMGLSLPRMIAMWWQTVWHVRFSLMTIAAMLSLGMLTRYSGLDATMGLAFARTGHLYPFFGTLLGWLGVALTGSDTSSNVLFGSLQKISAQQLGISPVLMAAANSAGGVMGKMVDAQSIVVASTATEWYGREGDILRYVFWHSVALACLVGVLVLLQAYVRPFTALVGQ